MKVVGQPESYSEMLERIFVTTMVTGVGCTYILARASHAFGELLDSWKQGADLGPIKDLKLAYVAIPVLIALVSRIMLLHDRISDLLLLRQNFEWRHILRPLASVSGIADVEALKKTIIKKRKEIMREVFYKYADGESPEIDTQLVRSALDAWGWFWSMAEADVLLILTAAMLLIIGDRFYIWVVAGLVGIVTLGATLLSNRCKRIALSEVDAILFVPARRAAIGAYFSTLN